MMLFSLIGISQYYPPPSCVDYECGTLTICPPDSVPAYTGGLMGYNLYVNDNYIEFISQTNPTDTVTYLFDPLPDPGNDSFCVKALYQNWISDASCDTALVRYGFPLPFFEDWSSGTFDTNQWTMDDNSWQISQDEGDPSPCVSFQGQGGLTNYSKSLVSYPMLADTILHGTINLEFDLSLNCINSNGNEIFYVQAWDWTSGVWYNVLTPITNVNGSFGWSHQKINIGSHVRKKVFRVRFVAEGINSSDITSWYLDNLVIRRTCIAPQDLQTFINEDNNVEMNWISGSCGSMANQLSHITYGLYTSIGTGYQAEFDVASRFSKTQLANYSNNYIYSIDFVPGESSASYSLRIWVGDSATLTYEQPVEDFQVDEWNLVRLDMPQPIDTGQMLWIGYHVETNTGYPAGVDYGPAFDGWGNMMFWEGQWSTLLEIDQQLDYNWNIKAYIALNLWYCGNKIYRSVNSGEYSLIADIFMEGHYIDEEADPANSNCYLITDVRALGTDTCESEYSNESCTLPIGVPDIQKNGGVLIYPNPTNGQFTIESLSCIQKIQVMDLTGRIITETLANSYKFTVQTGDLFRGVYLIRIYSDEGIITRKVVVGK